MASENLAQNCHFIIRTANYSRIQSHAQVAVSDTLKSKKTTEQLQPYLVSDSPSVPILIKASPTTFQHDPENLSTLVSDFEVRIGRLESFQ